MPSLSFESDYGKWKYFDLAGGGKVKTEFSWDDPAGLPKPVLSVFTKSLTDKINDFMKDDGKRAEAIRKRIADWEKKIASEDIKSGKDLTAFVDTVNASLAERFPGISGGADGVAKIITAQAMKELPKDVAKSLEATKFTLKCKIVGSVVLAVSAVGLSIAATVLTAGLALPIAAAAVSGAAQLGKSGLAAYESLKAANNCSIALEQILERQRGTAKSIQDTVARAESQLYTLESEAKTAEAEATGLQKKIDEIKALYGRKVVDGIEIMSNVRPSTLGRINTLQKDLDDWRAKSASASAAVKKFSSLLDSVKKAFDPALYAKLAKENWTDLLEQFGDTYGPDLQLVVSGARDLVKIVQA